jgi:outer membrane protein OmpA-like peptidoglycan-associated protein
MTNLIYDFDVGWALRPHIGVGIGAVDVMENGRATGIGSLGNDDAWEFGYQAIAGASYAFNPNWSAELDYRYLATTDPTFKLGAAGGLTYKTGYSTHNIIASLVYHFTPPPPPPPMPVAAPPPAPTREVFLVFFDWDRDTITQAGGQIIGQAANSYRAGHRVQIQVTGYTDRSGSPGYNQRLSERRANNVAKGLAAQGVPRDQMAVNGRGENDNRVPTPDGVREPQNRRVEILLP